MADSTRRTHQFREFPVTVIVRCIYSSVWAREGGKQHRYFILRAIEVTVIGRTRTVLPTVDAEFGQTIADDLERHG